MTPDQAVKILTEATWRPGMEIRASAEYPWSAIGSIVVEVVFHTYDSSYPDADGGYRVPRSVAPSGVLSVTGLDEEALLHTVLRMVREAQEHEDREFLRVKRDGRWVAPFHPHNTDTDQAWERLEYQSQYRRATA